MDDIDKTHTMETLYQDAGRKRGVKSPARSAKFVGPRPTRPIVGALPTVSLDTNSNSALPSPVGMTTWPCYSFVV